MMRKGAIAYMWSCECVNTMRRGGVGGPGQRLEVERKGYAHTVKQTLQSLLRAAASLRAKTQIRDQRFPRNLPEADRWKKSSQLIKKQFRNKASLRA